MVDGRVTVSRYVGVVEAVLVLAVEVFVSAKELIKVCESLVCLVCCKFARRICICLGLWLLLLFFFKKIDMLPTVGQVTLFRV